MRSNTFHTVKGIVDWRLCLGCGACSYICPERKIQLVDVLSQGIRPLVENERCGSCRDCLAVCPAYVNDHRRLLDQPQLIPAVKSAYGPVVELWEGHATDPDVRFLGSSGGIITALSLFCLRAEGMRGVLHISGDPVDPIRNHTRFSRTQEELLEGTGSRYSPASTCDRLDLIEAAAGPCVFVGQPSEVTALRKAAAMRPSLAQNVGLALSFFCAGSPPTQATVELLRSEGIPLDDVAELRYRGRGWPGWFSVKRRSSGEFQALQTYSKSWGFLQSFRPLAVNLTPDGSGEDADISCGDPWYRPIETDEPGTSLVLVRTSRGRELLRKAHDAGYVRLTPCNASDAINSQVNLIRKRGAIWGRIAALRLFGLPTPELRGFSLFENWLKLSMREKAQSTLGTMRRIIRRGQTKPLRIDIAEMVRRRSSSIDATTP